MGQGFHSAEIVKTEEGRQYHIGLAPGEVHPFILLCGDVERVKKVAQFLDETTDPITSREYTTISGLYKGTPVSVMATGMGPDNTEIALVELSQIIEKPTLIRVGSSGAIHSDVCKGDLVISSGAIRLENVSNKFVMEGYPATAHYEVVLALLESASQNGRNHHLGVTATASSFYGPQGRTTPVFKSMIPDLPEKLAAMNVLNLEMEASTLFTMSSVAGYRSGAVCAIYAHRMDNTFIDPDEKKAAEIDCIKTALGAVEILTGMDKQKGGERYWLPKMGA